MTTGRINQVAIFPVARRSGQLRLLASEELASHNKAQADQPKPLASEELTNHYRAKAGTPEGEPNPHRAPESTKQRLGKIKLKAPVLRHPSPSATKNTPETQ